MSVMSHQKAGSAYYYRVVYNYFDDIIIDVLILKTID